MNLSILYIVNTLTKYGIDIQTDIENVPQMSPDSSNHEQVLLVVKENESYRLTLSGLGIKYSPNSPLIINSRVETIKKKERWMNIFTGSRALVPMSGFYEWQKEEDKNIPYRIFIPGEELFFVAALLQRNDGSKLSTSLITTHPNRFVKPLHNRMPVILTIREGLKFLNCNSEDALSMCIPFSGEMKMEKVQ